MASVHTMDNYWGQETEQSMPLPRGTMSKRIHIRVYVDTFIANAAN